MKALILCNGEKPPAALFAQELLASDFLIACDGAAQTALAFSKSPDIIIGDLDSLSPELLTGPSVIRVSDQNSNDLEKALNLVLDMGFKEALIMGASGLRFDHFLVNLYILARFTHVLKLRLVDAYGEAWIASPLEVLSAPKKTPISFFALGEQPVRGLTLKGLEYSLDDAELEVFSPRAALNYMAEEQATISHRSGILLITKMKLSA